MTVTEDNALRLSLVERGLRQAKRYSWDEYAKKLWCLYEEVLSD